MTDPNSPRGRRFLVTGASKGIGRAVSEQLAARGDHPIGLARRRPQTFPGDFHEVDLSDREETARVLDQVTSTSTVLGLVNNVGLVQPAPLGSVDLDDLGRVYDLNVRVAVQAAQAVLPGMRASKWGRIVNVTSLVTLGVPGRTSYGAAKAALEFLARGWARELAAEGITVNAVSPGPTETELFRQNNPPGSDGEEGYLKIVPMRRFGQPTELAAAICFLLSEEAGYISGQTLRADGAASTGAMPV